MLKVKPKWLNRTDLGIFDESIKHPDNPYRKFDCEQIHLTPDEFIKFQKKMIGSKAFEKGIHEKHKDTLKKLIKDKEFDWFSFVLEFDKKGNLENFQEGRHRIVVMKELGIKKVPVYFCQRRR